MIFGRGKGVALAFVVATLTVSAAAAHRTSRETIVVRFRPAYALCVGVCPYFEMWVSPPGRVVTRDKGSGRIERFDVVPERLAAFRDVLLPLRPTGERRVDRTCEQEQVEGKPDPLSDPRTDDIEVRWIDGTDPGRLTACAGNMRVRQVVQDALRALGVTILGTRRDKS